MSLFNRPAAILFAIGWWPLRFAGAAPESAGMARSPELEAPFMAAAAGGPIDVEVGHAAPLFADFDGDGKADLLVGQFGGGKLLIYKNSGAPAAPSFSEAVLFRAGGKEGKVPAG